MDRRSFITGLAAGTAALAHTGLAQASTSEAFSKKTRPIDTMNRIGSRADGQQRPEDAPLHDEKHHEAHAHGAEENEGEDLLQECKTLVEPVLKRLDEPVDVLHERRNLLREAPPGLKTVRADDYKIQSVAALI